ncbi:hypothetical protein CIPAW_05G209200 [Carya illinoinensis]|uniref:Uncharacterized protein n=1 Tax=Carya illinoinensis TaxID=32201 RepID=A0A8T1QLG0_CARIL|nr:hypothetical protein CIPAW_05G209200 [Carya illinoinensis]
MQISRRFQPQIDLHPLLVVWLQLSLAEKTSQNYHLNGPGRRTKFSRTLLQCTRSTLGKKNYGKKISSLIPTKTPSQISLHFKHLVEDIQLIESGLLPPLRYYTNEHAEKKEQKMDEDDEDGNNQMRS